MAVITAFQVVHKISLGECFAKSWIAAYSEVLYHIIL